MATTKKKKGVSQTEEKTPKTKYNPEYHDDWAWSLALHGATDPDVAEAFGVSVRTIHRWKKEHPSFLEAYMHGKDAADSKVEKSLYQRAVGFEYDERERIVEMDPETGETKPLKIRTTTKRALPDTMAAMYWLNNRSKGKWTHKEKVEVSASADSDTEVLIYLPANSRDDPESEENEE